MKWKKIESDGIESDDNSEIWKPDTPDEWISGEYFDKDENIGLHNDSNLYHLRGEDGTHYKIWGSMVLDDLMGRVEMGVDVKIVYCGKRQGKKNFYKVFEVYTAEEDDGGESSSSSSGKSEPVKKGEKQSKRKNKVAGKLRYTANGLINDARGNLVGYGNMEPSQREIEKELRAMYDDGDMNTYKPYKKKQLLDACLQLLVEAHEDYEEFLNQ